MHSSRRWLVPLKTAFAALALALGTGLLVPRAAHARDADDRHQRRWLHRYHYYHSAHYYRLMHRHRRRWLHRYHYYHSAHYYRLERRHRQ